MNLKKKKITTADLGTAVEKGQTKSKVNAPIEKKPAYDPEADPNVNKIYSRANKDGTETFTQGAKTWDFTREEANAFHQRANVGGAITPNVQDAQINMNRGGAVGMSKEVQTGVDAKLAAEQAAKMEELQKSLQVTPERLAQIQAEVAAQGKDPLDFNILSQSIKEATAVGFAGGLPVGAAVGALAAPATLGLSIPAAAGLAASAGGVGGFITGALTGTFAMFKHQSAETAGFTGINVEKGKYNIRQAIMTANKGGDVALAQEQFLMAKEELYRAEAQYKTQSTDTYEWKNNIREKQEELNNYLTYSLPGMENRMAIALMKPDPAYVDYGLDEESGEPL